MALNLFELPEYPNQVAVSKIESFVTDGAFFLDFSRPLEQIRWFGVKNRWFGITIGLLVPVVHQCERSGGFVIGAHRGDPYFSELRALWKTRYPSEKIPPSKEADGLKLIADFATQFPSEASEPHES
jgi:hypothetical protein